MEPKRTLLERIDATVAKLNADVEEMRQQFGARLTTLTQELTVANAALAALITQLNDETNQIQARIDALIAGLQNVATPEQIADLQAISGRLAVLGQDPVNPIPTP